MTSIHIEVWVLAVITGIDETDLLPSEDIQRALYTVSHTTADVETMPHDKLRHALVATAVCLWPSSRLPSLDRVVKAGALMHLR